MQSVPVPVAGRRLRVLATPASCITATRASVAIASASAIAAGDKG